MSIKFKFQHLLLMGAVVLGSCQKDFVKVPPPPVITTPVTFSADIYPMLSASSHNCSDCHNNGGQSPDLSSDAAAYTALTTGGYVNTSAPATSTFYIAVTAGYSGPSGQMYPGGPYLTNEEQAKILAWITQGANH
jgi:mono/diheme cytochrome c family protein